jgi:hypothetical protein
MKEKWKKNERKMKEKWKKNESKYEITLRYSLLLIER